MHLHAEVFHFALQRLCLAGLPDLATLLEPDGLTQDLVHVGGIAAFLGVPGEEGEADDLG